MAKVNFTLEQYTDLLYDIAEALGAASHTTTNNPTLRAAGGAWAARGLLESARKAVIRCASRALKNPHLVASFALSTAEAIAVAAFIYPTSENEIAAYCYQKVGFFLKEELEPEASFGAPLEDLSATRLNVYAPEQA